MADTADDPLVFKVFNEIGIIDQLARTHAEKVLPYGLNLPQFTVLNHLARLGDGQSPAAMARAFQITKGAMTNTLQRLEKMRMITLRPDAEDGRMKRVSLTVRGRVARQDSIAALMPAFAMLAESVPEKEFAAALPFLQRIRQILDEDRDRP